MTLSTLKYRTSMRAIAAAAAASCTFGLAACGGSSRTAGEAVERSTTAAEVVTLQIGTQDGQSEPMTVVIDEFARLVNALSNGTIQIEPVLDAGPPAGVPNTGKYVAWDQFVARKVINGELDLGVVPARAWDTEGVMTLRALFAPFLIDSNAVLAAVVSDQELTDEMLAGFAGSGVTGLALLPESLRHAFAFGEPFTTPDDFAGKVIRAPRSATTYALFEALGATVDDPVGAEYEAAVASGSIAGAESSFYRGVGAPGGRPTATGNLTFFPNVNSLVINAEVFAALTGDQRHVLTEAADRTVDYTLDLLVDEATAATEYCTAIGDVVTIEDEAIAAFLDATEPVYVELRRDPRTAALIEQITRIKARTAPAPAIRPCSYASEDAATADANETIPFGSYTRTVTRAEAEALGVDPAFIDEVIGTSEGLITAWEFTEDGRFNQRADFCHCGTLERGDFGNYAYDQDGRLVLTSGNDASRGLVGVIEWTLADDILTMELTAPFAPPGETRPYDPIEDIFTSGIFLKDR